MSLNDDIRRVLLASFEPLTGASVAEQFGIEDRQQRNEVHKRLSAMATSGSVERIARPGERRRYVLTLAALASAGNAAQKAPPEQQAGTQHASAPAPPSARQKTRQPLCTRAPDPPAANAEGVVQSGSSVSIEREHLHVLLAMACATRSLLATAGAPPSRRDAAIASAARALL